MVVWKTSWIPSSNMIADGPVLRRFRNSPKWNFSSAAGNMRIILPVEPGTVLARDCATVVAAADAAQEAEFDSVVELVPQAAQKRQNTEKHRP